jgi:hypothetical protein
MSIKPLIDYIRFRADMTGAKMLMSRARDLIANLLFDRSYSASIAAERAGRLSNPELVPSRTARLRFKYGTSVVVIADIATAVVVRRTTEPVSGKRDMSALKFGLAPSSVFCKELKRRFAHTSPQLTLQYFSSTTTTPE